MNAVNEKISIIVPVYNAEKRLSQCIESLLGQDYTNIDIILINDGSVDQSLNICKEYANRDKRIRVISQSNQGPAVAKNSGIDVADGAYLMFVDSDDYVSPSFCSDAIENLKEYNSDIAIFGLARVIGNQTTNYLIKGKKDGLISKPDAMAYSIKNSFPVNKIYRKKVFSNIRYPKGKYYEDSFTTYKLFEAAAVISYTPKVNYFYIASQNSIVVSKSSEIIADQFESIADQFAFFEKKYPQIVEDNINELIIKALRYCTFCPKDYNQALYDRAYKILKSNRIPKNIEKRYKLTMGLFKFSAPLALRIFSIQRMRKQ